jgi:hypothetical protein
MYTLYFVINILRLKSLNCIQIMMNPDMGFKAPRT